MYNTIIMVLKTSKENKVDIGVAENILGVSENARKILKDYYKPITTFYREGELELINELCTLIENNSKKEIQAFLKKHKDFINKSFENASK